MTTGTDDREGEAFAKAGVGEDVRSDDRHTNQNEREVGHVASQACKAKQKGGNGAIACPQRGQTRGVLYARNVDTTSTLRRDG
jgi:hypothetical protein